MHLTLHSDSCASLQISNGEASFVAGSGGCVNGVTDGAAATKSRLPLGSLAVANNNVYITDR
jgi:hypothetical protein